MKKFILLLSLVTMPATGRPQSDARAEIFVLGTFHMSNPGRDLANVQADDVLAPKRQQEMAQLIEVLKKFRPTKIAIESSVGSTRIATQYTDYLDGKYVLTRNEIDQLGYRLAKELGHRAVHPVDEDGDFPYYRVRNYAKANDRAKQFEAIDAANAAKVKEQGDFLQTHTLLEMLEFMNTDARVARDVASYYELVPFGEPFEYAGPDLVAAWFQRNIRIYRNIVALADSPNDRILVIYGAGHLGWLRQNVVNDPRFKLRKLTDLTGRQ